MIIVAIVIGVLSIEISFFPTVNHGLIMFVFVHKFFKNIYFTSVSITYILIHLDVTKTNILIV